MYKYFVKVKRKNYLKKFSFDLLFSNLTLKSKIANIEIGEIGSLILFETRLSLTWTDK